MAKEKVDYTQLIPPPPEDIVEEILRQGAFEGTDLIIFKTDYIRMPLTDRKEKMIHCVCTACRAEWYCDVLEDEMGCTRGYSKKGFRDDGNAVYEEDRGFCPECGAAITYRHSGKVRPDSRYNHYSYITVFGKLENKLTAADYCVIQRFEKNSQKHYEVKNYNAYIFETDKRCIQLSGQKKIYNSMTFLAFWWQKSRVDGYLDDKVQYIYPYGKDLLEGTVMENCRLDAYLDVETKDGYKNPIKYLRLWQMHHNVETLMDMGLGYMVAKELESLNSYSGSGCSVRYALSGVNWKEKSPFKMLGFDRSEMKMIKAARLEWNFLARWKTYKEHGFEFTADNINIAKDFDSWTVRRIIERGMPVKKTLKYLKKQEKGYSYLEDYWNMCRRADLDLDNEVVKFPKDLGRKHDDLVRMVKWHEDEKRKETFSLLCQKLKEESWSDGSICIRIAENERELIEEGKILEHCVGGYGRAHCEGKSIFFVRKAEKPEEPWYTLQMNLLNGKSIQLHGYKNDRFTPIPQEVRDFVDYWMKNVFKPFDVKKMEFCS